MRGAIIGAAAMLPLATGCASYEERVNAGYVTNFAECIEDGSNPIIGGNPRRCLHNGDLYVEGR